MCQLEFSVSCGLKPVQKTGHTAYVIYTLCASLATAVVAIGGLGSVQSSCADAIGFAPFVDGFSGVLPCKKVFRYYWFIIALEFVVATAALLAVSAGKLQQYRNALVGLFSVACLLWIYQSNAFLGLNEIGTLTEGASMRDRLRTMVAGSIMTATLNAFNIMLIGYEAEESSDKPSVSVEQAAQ